MKTKMTREQAIRNYVEQLSGKELSYLIQRINAFDGSFEDATYFYMEDFNSLMSHYTPLELVQMAYSEDFNPNEDYFTFDDCGKLVSLDEYAIESHAMDLRDDVIDHLIYCYKGDTPWEALTAMVDADDDAIFNEDYEEVEEDDDDDDDDE